MEQNFGKNMMLIDGVLQKFDKETNRIAHVDTLRMMPLTNDCPFTEIIYDPTTTLMVIIGKTVKQAIDFLPKMDDDGNMIKCAKKANGNDFKEERVILNQLQEYKILNYQEQIDIIEAFAVNTEAFDYKKIIRNVEEEHNTGIQQLEKQPIVNKHGAPLKITKK